jgi:3-hydroxy-9,10-secoandrosta-1,3,5(10)-triene-9,17-dione monooxygenase
VVPDPLPVPEPDLTPETLIERARALIPAVRDQQDEAERLGHHTAELDRTFTEAGFYRILQPRRFGGYQFGLPTFWRVMLAVSEGDPGTGWALTLGAHHALGIGAWFSEAGQREIFGPSGDFRAPHRAPPMGRAQPVDGGYVIRGTWDYCPRPLRPPRHPLLVRPAGSAPQDSWTSRPRTFRPSSMSR